MAILLLVLFDHVFVSIALSLQIHTCWKVLALERIRCSTRGLIVVIYNKHILVGRSKKYVRLWIAHVSHSADDVGNCSCLCRLCSDIQRCLARRQNL